MFVRSRGGWLRRVIASGATILVVLGAVLVTPSSASAADPPSIKTNWPCGTGTGNKGLSGKDMPLIEDGQYVQVDAYAPDGHRVGGARATVDNADHEIDAAVVLTAAGETRVRYVASLWETNTDPDGGPDHRIRDLAEFNFVIGCGYTDPQHYNLQQKDGTQPISLKFGTFAVGTPITLTMAGGITLTPATVTPTAADPEPTVDITLSKQPPCGESRLEAVQVEGDPGLGLTRKTYTEVEIKCPTLTAAPAALSDIELPGDVKLTGADWFDDGDFVVTLDGVQVGTGTATGGGDIAATISVSPRDCGPQVITVVQDEEEVVIGLTALTTSAGALAAAAPSALAAAFAPDAQLTKSTTIQIDCADPKVAVNPELVAEHDGPQVLWVRPSQFRPGVPVQLSLPGTVLTPSVIPADPDTEDGAAKVTLDHQPACGKNTLTARQEPFVPGKPAKVATTSIHVVCPRLTVTPPNVQDSKLPDPVTVQGTGWVPNVPVRISYDGKVQGDPVTPGAAGTIDRSVEIPQSACGKHVISARQLVTPKDNPAPLPRVRIDTEVAQQTILNVDCSTPFVSVLPQVMVEKAGPQKLGVRISGFLQNLPVTLAVPGTTATPGTLTPSRTSPGEGTITLNKQPACGDSTLTASQVRTDAEFPVDRKATAKLRVFCPRLAINPASVPDTALPGKVAANGTSWVPNQDIQVLVDGVATNKVRPGDTGVLDAAQVSVPRSGCGPHVVEAVQVVTPAADPAKTHLPVIDSALTLRAKATLTVVCTPAFLAADPSVVGDGNTTVAAGVGFTPGRQVQLAWTYLDGSPMGDACAAEVSKGGTFLVTCLVLPNTALGTRLLTAAEKVPAGDPVIARTGQAEVLIVPGSMTPKHGRFLERR